MRSCPLELNVKKPPDFGLTLLLALAVFDAWLRASTIHYSALPRISLA